MAISNNAVDNFILILEDGNQRRTIDLSQSKYSIGRHADNAIVVQSPQASRRHATFVRKFDRKRNRDIYWIFDGDLEGNKSHNGIFINGEKCLVHELKDRDLINFGCEVNASFHEVSNAAEMSLESHLESPHPTTPVEQESPSENTLMLSDGNLENPDEEDTFQEQAYIDPLTDLPNQYLFNEYLSIALTNAKRHQDLVAVFLIDIHQFNQINETWGYAVGDRLLKALAQRLKSCLRSGDIIARWEGDAFAVLLPQVKEVEHVETVSGRVLQTLQQPLELDHQPFPLNCYLGMALYPQDGDSDRLLLTKAQSHLLHDRQFGLITQSDSDASALTARLSRVENRLYQAMMEGELSLSYQPQVNLKTGDIEAIEAFVRWNHPQRGLISPEQFLPWAEQTELILPLTNWILETACRQNCTWQEQGLWPIVVSVNLSVNQFYHSQLINLLGQVLSSTGLAPQALELEVTESTVFKNIEFARQMLHDLQQLGVYLCLDDFGKGYAAVNVLAGISFHKLKIDRSLIATIGESSNNTTLIKALINLGQSFNLKVVAEGVETHQQLETLYALDCQIMQGYYFSQPLPASQATEFLRLHRTKAS